MEEGVSMVFALNSALVQHDWTETPPREKFFIGIKHFFDKNFTFYDAHLAANGLDFDVPECFDKEKLIVERLSPSKLAVKFPDCEYQTVFVAPAQQFSAIHTSDVYSVDVSTNGEMAVSSGCDGQLKLWRLKDGMILHTLEGHVLDVNRVRFFPSGLVVISAGMDMSVRIWCTETGQCVRTLKGHIRAVNDIAFIGEGSEVFTCSSDGTIRRWCCATSDCISTITPVALNVSVNAIALKEFGDSKILVAATEAGVVVGYIISNENNECFFRFPLENSSTSACTAIHLNSTRKKVKESSTAMEIDNKESPESLVCFSGTVNGEIHCIDIIKRSLLALIKTNCGRVTRLDTFKDQLVASFADGSVKVISLPICEPRIELTGPDCYPVYDFSIKVPGLLVSVCRDKILRLYNLFL